MGKSQKQIELENQSKVWQIYRPLINSWITNQLREGIAPTQIKKDFITYCKRAKVSFSEAKQMVFYLRTSLINK